MTQSSEKLPVSLCVLIIAVGVIPMFFDLKPAGGAPKGVLYSALSVFILAGAAGLFPRIAFLIGPTIFIIFASIATWIGFSPNAKGCTSSISFNWFTQKGSTGCGPFAISAIILWLIVLAIVVGQIKNFLKGKK